MTKPQLVGLDGQELRKAELVVPRGIDSTTDISIAFFYTICFFK